MPAPKSNKLVKSAKPPRSIPRPTSARPSDEPILLQRVVLVFDISSSTSMLEDLKSTDNLVHWRNLLIGLKEFLKARSLRLGFEIYKFVGDGWILMLPINLTKSALLNFIRDLARAFNARFDEHVRDFLQRTPEVLGITVGVDSGQLIGLRMHAENEYLGRALNVASRLQGMAKGDASNKALFSKNSFNSLKGQAQGFTLTTRRVTLRNLNNGQPTDCLEWQILL